ncbi:MAG: SdrD B-like domain-containing protein, partial [Candidatus Eisenbacteria bacterium]
SFLGCLEGTATVVCNGSTPAAGVTVDLYSLANVLLETTVTDVNGHYGFSGLETGDYKITIVTPAGFVADSETKTTTVSMGDCAVVDFTFTCLQITPCQRTIGYWKHQVNVYLTGKGKAQESLAELSAFMEEIRIHFNENLLNPVKIFEVEEGGHSTADSLMVLQRLLTVNKDGTMKDRAKQQMIALLLNVVSFKLSQTQVISADGANVSQAITYCDGTIDDGVSTNDERAKTIADMINNGQTVPAGWIPLSTPVIYYERGRGSIVYLGKGYPNPFNHSASISFALKGEGLIPVQLKVYDVTGRVVRTIIDRDVEPGSHSVTWNGIADDGARVSSGVYFYELKTGDSVATGKLVVRR